MRYCKHIGNGVFDKRLFAIRGADCYPYVSTADTRDGYTCYCVGYQWQNEGVDATGVYEYVKNDTTPTEETRYSVRSIIRELRAAGKYDAVRALLKASKLDWDFVGANYLSTADADFQAMCEAIVSAEIATEQELDALLAKCIWEE